MRQVALTIETTGLGKDARIVELAAVELIDGKPTGKAFNVIINPHKNIEPDASHLHHMEAFDVEHKADFKDAVPGLFEFIHDATVVIHYAKWANPIIDHELKLAGYSTLKDNCARIFDTYAASKKLYPAERSRFDDIALRYQLIRQERTDRVGARDARLLADVFVKIIEDAKAKEVNLDEQPVPNKSRLFQAKSNLPPAARHRHFISHHPGMK